MAQVYARAAGELSDAAHGTVICDQCHGTVTRKPVAACMMRARHGSADPGTRPEDRHAEGGESMIYVCNLAEMAEHSARVRPERIVSLVAPGEQPPTPLEIDAHCHLRIAIHDICAPEAGYILPQGDHITSLITFVEQWPAERPMLVHCFAGISRSMAAAMIALTIKSGDETASGRAVRRAAPHAQPNRRMIVLADELLGCDGRLIEARDAMGPAVPAVVGPLVRLPLIG